MNDIALIPQDGGIAICPNGENENGNGISIGMPFSTTIVLHEDIVVAGTTHIADLDSILENVEFPADVHFVRDPDNMHDAWAIKVMLGGDRIGFVPCDVNEILARLMDGGKRIEGTVFEKELLGRWTKLHMEVRLVD